MKKFLVLFSLLIACFVASAQKGKVYTITDTLQGSETVNFNSIFASGDYSSLFIEATFTQLGGTSDGLFLLEQGINSFKPMTSETTSGVAWSNADSCTITNGLVQQIYINNPGAYKYRARGVGTASDTTLVTIRYIFK